MSDQLDTPEAEEASVWDLACVVDGPADSYLVGYAAVIKLLTPDGRLLSRFVAHEMNNFETVGLFQAHLDLLRQENVLSLIGDPEEDEEDDEE